MKKTFTISAVLVAASLFVGVAFADTNNSTDLIYGNVQVAAAPSEAYVPGGSEANNSRDLVYGNVQVRSARSEAPNLLADSDNNSTDIVYGS